MYDRVMLIYEKCTLSIVGYIQGVSLCWHRVVWGQSRRRKQHKFEILKNIAQIDKCINDLNLESHYITLYTWISTFVNIVEGIHMEEIYIYNMVLNYTFFIVWNNWWNIFLWRKQNFVNKKNEYEYFCKFIPVKKQIS